MNSCLLTNQFFERNVALHGNSCAEFSSSNFQALNTLILTRVFLCTRLSVSMGRLRGTFVRRILGIGLLTCNRLTNIFSRIWCGLKAKVDIMDCTIVSNSTSAREHDLICDVHLYSILLSDQLIALEIILEATISARGDSFSRAIMCQTSNISEEFKRLKLHVQALAELRGLV